MKHLLIILFIGLSILGVKGQNNNTLKAKSLVYITFKFTEGEESVDPSDAITTLSSILKDKTSCNIVSNIEDADFICEIEVIKKTLGNRSAKLKLKNAKDGVLIFETKWVKGTSNAIHGYSSTRHALSEIVKKHLIKKYPEIIW